MIKKIKIHLPIIGHSEDLSDDQIQQKIFDIQNFENIALLYKQAADCYKHLSELDVEGPEEELELYDGSSALELERDCIKNAAEYFENAAYLAAKLIASDLEAE